MQLSGFTRRLGKEHGRPDPSPNEKGTTRPCLDVAYFPDVMTDVSGSESSSLDAGEAADGRSDAPMDMAMEVATVVISNIMGTVGEKYT